MQPGRSLSWTLQQTNIHYIDSNYDTMVAKLDNQFSSLSDVFGGYNAAVI